VHWGLPGVRKFHPGVLCRLLSSFKYKVGPGAGTNCPGPWQGKEVSLPMRKQTSGSRRIDDPRIVQRSVVLMLLDDDHAERWSRADIERELFDVVPGLVGDALERLKDGAVVELEGEEVWALAAARYLGELGMVCV